MISEALKKFYQLFKDSLPEDKKAEAGTLIDELIKEAPKEALKAPATTPPAQVPPLTPSATGAAAIDDAWQKEKAAYEARMKALEDKYENDRKTARETAADEFIKKQVAELKIPADNDTAKNHARALYLADPAAAEAIISQLTPAKPTQQTPAQKPGAPGEPLVKDTMQSLRERAIASVDV